MARGGTHCRPGPHHRGARPRSCGDPASRARRRARRLPASSLARLLRRGPGPVSVGEADVLRRFVKEMPRDVPIRPDPPEHPLVADRAPVLLLSGPARHCGAPGLHKERVHPVRFPEAPYRRLVHPERPVDPHRRPARLEGPQDEAPLLRAQPRVLRLTRGHPPPQEPDHAPGEAGLLRSRQELTVPGEAPAPPEPADQAFHHPSPRQHGEPRGSHRGRASAESPTPPLHRGGPPLFPRPACATPRIAGPGGPNQPARAAAAAVTGSVRRQSPGAPLVVDPRLERQARGVHRRGPLAPIPSRAVVAATSPLGRRAAWRSRRRRSE